MAWLTPLPIGPLFVQLRDPNPFPPFPLGSFVRRLMGKFPLCCLLPLLGPLTIMLSILFSKKKEVVLGLYLIASWRDTCNARAELVFRVFFFFFFFFLN